MGVEAKCCGARGVGRSAFVKTTARRGTIFWFSKIAQFPNKTASFHPATFFVTPKIHNLYGAILIFRGFFWSDPHPTRDFCRNMA
jgi:hypothetical protein